ncbi:MAG TPA: lipase family protein [Candidatus Solibacter sp.]|nr:lipase family protein [Candidatus Solibacter sp.]
MQFAKILDGAGFLHFDLLGDWSAGSKGTQGYFCYTKDFAVMAFRGTEKDDWKDLAADLATCPVDEDETEQKVGAAEKTMFHLPSARAIFDHSEPAVHRGFQAALNEVWKRASAMLTEYRSQSRNEIFFTGHSLGAALATLAISRFKGGNASLYTFGSPRVGNRVFSDIVRANATLGQFRIVDDNDLVTRVPPALFWYTHSPATLYQIDSNGLVQDRTTDPTAHASDAMELSRDLKCLSELQFPINDDSKPPADIYDHSPGRYCNRIWNGLA